MKLVLEEPYWKLKLEEIYTKIEKIAYSDIKFIKLLNNGGFSVVYEGLLISKNQVYAIK